MGASLSALFEFQIDKVQQEKTSKMEKEIDSLRSAMNELKSDSTQLKIDYARLLTDLSEVYTDLRILHPLPYARLHLQKCINHQITCNDAVNAFISLHTLPVIHSTPSLTLQLQALKRDLKKAWDARFAAAFLCEPPPTLESILWIVAKSGYTKEVAPFMNLSKATRECKNLQRVMREVRNRWGWTRLNYFCYMGVTSSVKRMLEMKSIDVEAKQKGEEDGRTCLINAARNGHLDICRLLIDKGAQVNAKDSIGCTPLHLAAWKGHIEILRPLCDRGADIEARNQDGSRPLHYAVKYGHFPIMKELIEVRNAGINARDDDGWTALREARHSNKAYIVSYLFSHGGIE
jgi:hypothetical protein